MSARPRYRIGEAQTTGMIGALWISVAPLLLVVLARSMEISSVVALVVWLSPMLIPIFVAQIRHKR
jgi:hypothetical protein